MTERNDYKCTKKDIIIISIFVKSISFYRTLRRIKRAIS